MVIQQTLLTRCCAGNYDSAVTELCHLLIACSYESALDNCVRVPWNEVRSWRTRNLNMDSRIDPGQTGRGVSGLFEAGEAGWALIGQPGSPGSPRALGAPTRNHDSHPGCLECTMNPLRSASSIMSPIWGSCTNAATGSLALSIDMSIYGRKVSFHHQLLPASQTRMR